MPYTAKQTANKAAQPWLSRDPDQWVAKSDHLWKHDRLGYFLYLLWGDMSDKRQEHRPRRNIHAYIDTLYTFGP